jgi:hypothetical protein
MNVERLEANLRTVRDRMAAACDRAGRDRADVTLVAVTKTVDSEAAWALVGLGVADLGENRMQELRDKREALSDLDVRWHMIGHLQRNKVKYAVRLCHLVHSVDSVRLAEALSRRAVSRERTMPVLVEVNVSGEESKFGIPADRAADVIRRMANLPGLHVRGLMTMAPFVDDAETVRPVFVTLRELSERVADLGLPGVEMAELSMGMTQDYEVAIEEGATMVRVGTALFRGTGH